MPAVYDSARTFNAILSIFFVVILSEGWRQIASHPDQEDVLRLDINHEMQKVAPDLYGKLDLLVTETLPTFSSETILPSAYSLEHSFPCLQVSSPRQTSAFWHAGCGTDQCLCARF